MEPFEDEANEDDTTLAVSDEVIRVSGRTSSSVAGKVATSGDGANDISGDLISFRSDSELICNKKVSYFY